MPLNALGADLRYALRSMRKNAGFTAVAVAALGLGIGANTAIFSIARAVVLAPLPFPNADRLVEFSTVSRKTGQSDTWVSYPDVLDWRERNRSFQSIGAYSFVMLNLTGGNEPLALYGSRISYDLFPTLGVQPELGRNFLPQEDQPGHAQEIILSYDLWVNRFERDPHIIGKAIRLIGRRESEQYVAVGVMAAGFNFPLNIPSAINPPTRQMAYWIPIGVRPNRQTAGDLDVMAIGLLRSGVSIRKAQKDMASVSAGLERDYPDTNLGRGVEVSPLKDQILGRTKTALLLLLLAISTVVLITCVNIANLLLSRALGRTRETGIRLALGASRARLVQQWLTESLLISCVGGCAGLLIAYAGLGMLLSLAPQDIPRLAQVRLDFEVLLFTAGVSIFAGLFFGNLPAWSAARTGVSAALTESGIRTTADPGRVRIRDLLVLSEVALAVLLAIGAGLLVKSFAKLTRVNPGFTKNNVLVSLIILPRSRYPEEKLRAGFYRKLLDEIKTHPGVVSAGATDGIPLGGNASPVYVQIDGRSSIERGENRPSADVFSASTNYLSTMGIALLRGRYLTDEDAVNGARLVVVDQSAAQRFWPNEDAVGRRIRFEDQKGQPMDWEVVGVVEATRDRNIDGPAVPTVYVPLEKGLAPPQFLAVRTRGKAYSMAAAIRQAVEAVDRDQPVFLVTSMEDIYNNSISDRRFTAFVLSILGLLATGLAALGVYGVISYSAAQRTKEIGIRRALGAQRIEIVQLVVSDGALLSGAGIGIGMVAGMVLTRFLSSLLYEVTPTDPWIIGGVALMVAAIALIAAYLPCYRAMKIQPMTALRHE